MNYFSRQLRNSDQNERNKNFVFKWTGKLSVMNQFPSLIALLQTSATAFFLLRKEHYLNGFLITAKAKTYLQILLKYFSKIWKSIL